MCPTQSHAAPPPVPTPTTPSWPPTLRPPCLTLPPAPTPPPLTLQDRVHRLGQPRDVHVYRYVQRGTIEERMLQLQAQKQELVRAAFHSKDKRLDNGRQMRINDVKLLMEL